MNTTTMKAMVTTGYGPADVLQLKEVDKPIPKDDEVLVKIHATSVTAAHTAMRTGKPYFGRLFLGLTKPKTEISGTDFAGAVVETGRNVKKFKPGDHVFGSTDIEGGTYAEYVCLSEKNVILKKPDNISFEEATAIIEGASTSLPFLTGQAKLSEGQKILINGASGSIGTAAVQLAKHLGAEVTGICSSGNVDMVKSLGADKVIDYTTEDFIKNGEKYDVIFDTVGKTTYKKCKNSLKEDGLFLSPVLGIPMLIDMLKSSLLYKMTGKGKRAIFIATGLAALNEKILNFTYISELMADGRLKAMIDRKYSLEEIPEAHRYVDMGHKKGNVVVVMEN